MRFAIIVQSEKTTVINCPDALFNDDTVTENSCYKLLIFVMVMKSEKTTVINHPIVFCYMTLSDPLGHR